MCFSGFFIDDIEFSKKVFFGLPTNCFFRRLVAVIKYLILRQKSYAIRYKCFKDIKTMAFSNRHERR